MSSKWMDMLKEKEWPRLRDGDRPRRFKVRYVVDQKPEKETPLALGYLTIDEDVLTVEGVETIVIALTEITHVDFFGSLMLSYIEVHAGLAIYFTAVQFSWGSTVHFESVSNMVEIYTALKHAPHPLNTHGDRYDLKNFKMKRYEPKCFKCLYGLYFQQGEEKPKEVTCPECGLTMFYEEVVNLPRIFQAHVVRVFSRSVFLFPFLAFMTFVLASIIIRLSMQAVDAGNIGSFDWHMNNFFPLIFVLEGLITGFIVAVQIYRFQRHFQRDLSRLKRLFYSFIFISFFISVYSFAQILLLK